MHRVAEQTAKRIIDALASLRLTIFLLTMSMVLVFVATLDQVNLGIWAVQEKYFRTLWIWWGARGVELPLFPGGYTLGGLLMLNLMAAHYRRFKLTARKSGIWLIHLGLMVLLVGEFLTGLLQRDYFLRLDEGETKSYLESYNEVELAIIDTSPETFDRVVSIPSERLESLERLQVPHLPFTVATDRYHPNSRMVSRVAAHRGLNVGGMEADRGVGLQIEAISSPVTFRTDERNVPSAYVNLYGSEGRIGTWVVSPFITEPQMFDYDGKRWLIELRFARQYLPFSLTLLQFNHDRYPGTLIPRNFSSRLRLLAERGDEDQEVLISMNNPLRHGGKTFYQAGFDNNDRTTILQVVRNPGWLLPYIACTLMVLGLCIQFGIRLTGFLGKSPSGSRASSLTGFSLFHRASLWVLVPLALLTVGILIPRGPQSEFDLRGHMTLPTLADGRLKPLDTVARTALLQLQGRQQVQTHAGQRISADEWLLDMLYRQETANEHPVIEIVHPDVLGLLELRTDQGVGKKRFSFNQIAGRRPELARQAQLADEVEPALRNAYQRAVWQLQNRVALYLRIQHSLLAPGLGLDLAAMAAIDTTIDDGLQGLREEAAGRDFDRSAVRKIMQLTAAVEQMEANGHLHLIAPAAEIDQLDAWGNAGRVLRGRLQGAEAGKALNSHIKMGIAWQERDAATFNSVLATYRDSLQLAIGPWMSSAGFESTFNKARPFYASMVLFLAAFLGAVVGWLRWPNVLLPAAWWVLLFAFLLTSAGILARMWIEGRPPVTNLYSSALFVGWGAVALCLILEKSQLNGLAGAAGGVVGFCALLIAHHLSLGGDTMEMMRAVLNSNFWLATHVVVVTLGYSATFLAGFLGLLHVVRAALPKGIDEETSNALARMVYGVVCFATLFSFAGTVLGGIWADQSWGRFWGWDPKENGALIIVIWNAVILHARWGGLIKNHGLFNLAIFGNIVTSWSWFGTNMLGVGLHSYGFMDSAFWWLIAFVVSQLLFIAMGLFQGIRARPEGVKAV